MMEYRLFFAAGLLVIIFGFVYSALRNYRKYQENMEMAFDAKRKGKMPQNRTDGED